MLPAPSRYPCLCPGVDGSGRARWEIGVLRDAARSWFGLRGIMDRRRLYTTGRFGIALFALGVGLAAASCGRSELGIGELQGLPPTADAGSDVRADSPDAPKFDAPDVGRDVWPDVVPDVPIDVPPHPCATVADCEDGDTCTFDSCENGMCSYSWIDNDHDGHVYIGCGGDDCNDLNPVVYSGHKEVCNDGVDNDCNGLTDCLDTRCKGLPDCGCTPDPAGENCSNSKDDDCNGLVDCDDPKCIGTTGCGCLSSESGKCDDGVDNDCDSMFDCEDPDCATATVCTCKSRPEDCSNKIDDNCNLLVDCADPQCEGSDDCACIPPGKPEVCNDNKDNDCNGLVDCADSMCIFSAYCKQCVPEVCNDNKDNDCNNLIDCADPACLLDPACSPEQEICNNGLDDDRDGWTDCEDPDCKDNPYCVVQQSNCQTAKLISASGTYTGNTTGHKNYTTGSCGGAAGEAVYYFVLTVPTKVHFDTIGTGFDSALYLRKGSCEEGQELRCDDDSAGSWAALIEIPILYQGTYYLFVDGFAVDPVGGPNEGPFVLNAELTPNPPEICNNSIDDDGDVYVDCADPDCVNVGRCIHCDAGYPPGPEFGPSACTDGLDNDCDGVADCKDSDCNASDYYKAECCNGEDDNGNQIVDEFSCRCASDDWCDVSEICYTHTVFACGPPCNQFFGNICPFVAPGSYCSTVTYQCEFP
jgi:hypothetical protein